MKPQNLEEKLVWYYLVGTYVWYMLGALIVLSPLLAWFLALRVGNKLWNQSENTPDAEKIRVPLTIWVWLISMLVMYLALVVGHIDFELSIFSIVTLSIFEFVKLNILLALFPLSGCLNIRPQLIYRAICIVCLQSLIFIGIGYLASILHVPGDLYVSPMKLIGRGGSIYYSVALYGIEVESNSVRLALFAPWAPAIGLVSNVYFFLALQESNKKWRWIGMIGAVAMAVVSVSRLALLCLPIVLLLTWFLTNFTQPSTQFTAGVISLLSGMFAPLLIDSYKSFKEAFDSARAGSSRVRKILKEIGLESWQQEAPIWGHGESEPGPKVVEHMPLGSHHTWVGLLYLKGIAGFISLSIPLLWSFIDLLVKAQKSKTAKAGLSVVLVLFLFSFGESIEILTYLYWPGLLIMGIAFKENGSSSINTSKLEKYV